MNYHLKSLIVRLTFVSSMLLPILLFIFLGFYFGSVIYCNQDYDPPIPNEIKPISPPKKGLLTLWFDSVNKTDSLFQAFNLMDKYHFVGMISVPTKHICKTNYLSWKQLQYLQKKGWETSIAYCSMSDKVDNDAMMEELVASQKALNARGFEAGNIALLCPKNELFFQKPTSFLSNNYLSLRWLQNNLNPLPIVNGFQLKAYRVSNHETTQDIKQWIKEARKSNAWLILVFDQINEKKLDSGVTLSQFEDILMTIQKTKIPVVLPTQVLRL